MYDRDQYVSFADLVHYVFLTMVIVCPLLFLASWREMRRLGIKLDTPESERKQKFTKPSHGASFIYYEACITFAGGLLFLLFLAVGGGVAFLIGEASLWLIKQWWFVPIALGSAYGFYVLRTKRRYVYAILEVFVGIGAIAASILGPASSDISRLLALVGGLYVIVRGLDNFDQGYKALESLLPARAYSQVEMYWEVWGKWTFRTREAFLDHRDKNRNRIEASANNGSESPARSPLPE